VRKRANFGDLLRRRTWRRGRWLLATTSSPSTARLFPLAPLRTPVSLHRMRVRRRASHSRRSLWVRPRAPSLASLSRWCEDWCAAGARLLATRIGMALPEGSTLDGVCRRVCFVHLPMDAGLTRPRPPLYTSCARTLSCVRALPPPPPLVLCATEVGSVVDAWRSGVACPSATDRSSMPLPLDAICCATRRRLELRWAHARAICSVPCAWCTRPCYCAACAACAHRNALKVPQRASTPDTRWRDGSGFCLAGLRATRASACGHRREARARVEK